MTPFELDILLWYHSHAEDHPVTRNNPPIWKDTRDFFLREGFLALTDDGESMAYKPTARLHCFIEHICGLPLPA